jgi:hypothetical protein
MARFFYASGDGNMKHKLIWGVLGCLAMALAPTRAIAAGKITSITVQKTASIGQAVGVRVYGEGNCSQVVLRCEAGESNKKAFQNPGFPISTSCTYATAGLKKLEASSGLPRGGDCTGTASAEVTVLPSGGFGGALDDLCKIVKCSGSSVGLAAAGPVPGLVDKSPPKITAVIGLFQAGSPFPILILGSGFGPEAGKVNITGNFGTKQMLGNPNSPPFNPLDWSSTGKGIGAWMPGNITGVQDHQATVQVIKPGGEASNHFPVDFVAAREFGKLLPHNDVQLLSCGDDGNFDLCNDKLDPDDSYGPFVSECDASLCGDHANNWGAIGDDIDKDVFQISLKNGWKLESIVIDKDATGGSIGSPSPSFPPDETSWTPTVSWKVTSGDQIYYRVYISINGPKGTSYK